MKILYLDLGMGVAGDMLTAALLELLDPKEQEVVIEKLNRMGLEGVKVTRETAVSCGIRGSRVHVIVNGEEEGHDHEHDHHHHDHDHGHDHHHHDHDHDHGHHDHDHDHHHHDHDHDHHHGHHHHHHSSMADIESLVRSLEGLSPEVAGDVLKVYGLIAGAEGRAHGAEVGEVHFHEVGMKDAVMDVAAVCLLMSIIAPDKVIAGPVNVGGGTVRCAHGIMPVPAPATAFLLEGIPMYGSGAEMGELCTPTGAALIRYFADEYGEIPLMIPDRTGYGMGSREYDRPNCVRLTLGEIPEEPVQEMAQFSCNVDDMTSEEAGFAMEAIFEAGAVEVFTVPAGMKKSRPGLLLEVICPAALREKVIAALFENTTTLGIRETAIRRHTLSRNIIEEDTPYGKIHVKESSGYGVTRRKYEYEDLSRLAREQGIGLLELKSRLGRGG